MRGFTMLIISLVSAGCFPRGPELLGDQDPRACDDAFDDHTHRGSIDVAKFDSFAENPGESPVHVDFFVSFVAEPAIRQVRFEDGAFYEFHDQWLWFRLMNGMNACGSSANPMTGGERFDSIAAIEATLKGKVELPLDLARTTGGRYVSPTFYTLAFRSEPRVYVPGTMFRRDDKWWFELEVSDVVKESDLVSTHAALEAVLPAGSVLFWRAISPEQSELGTRLQRGGGVLSTRVLRLGEEP